MPLTEHDPSHLAQRWVSAGWRDILVSRHLEWCHRQSVAVCFSIAGKRSPTQTMYVSATQAPIETKNPRVNLLVTKWQHVWLLALDRRRKLNDAMDRLEEVISTIRFWLSVTFFLSASAYKPSYFSHTVERICKLRLWRVAEALHALDEPQEVSRHGLFPPHWQRSRREGDPAGVHRRHSVF